MSESTCFSHPRLGMGDAIAIVGGMHGKDIESIHLNSGLDHPKAYPPAVGRPLASREYLADLRRGVVRIARDFGFPYRTDQKSPRLSEFDAALGNFLLESLKITPAEAGVDEIWNFLTLVLLPDIAAWRYPNRKNVADFDRWIGKRRNVLRKAWWRAYCLGPELNLLIGEDEGVAVMERPTFGANPSLARAIVSTHLERYTESSAARSDLLRVAMVQLGRLVSILNLDCLGSEDMQAVVDRAYDLAVASFAK